MGASDLLQVAALAAITSAGAVAAAQPAPEPVAPAPPPPPDAVAPPVPVAPAPSDRWWESHVPVPRDSSHARTALVSVGVPLAGLGASMLLGSGIAAIIAWSSASDLEAECPGKLCVEGTPGGRSYVRARDASRATEIMAALGFPTVAVGAVLLMFTAGTEKPAAAGATPRVTVQVGPTSGALEVRF